MERVRLLEPSWLTHAYPRCLHVGRCGGISFHGEIASSAEEICNVTADLEVFARTWVAPMMEGGALMQSGDDLTQAMEAMPHNPRSAWHISEGVAVCRERYMADESGGTLAGVAQMNLTLPQKFEDACTAIIDPTPN